MFAGSRPLLALVTAILLSGLPLSAQNDPYITAVELYRKGGDMELTLRALQGWRRHDFENAIDRFLPGAGREAIEAAAVLQLEFALASVAQSASSAQFHLETGMRILRRLTAPYRSQSEFPPDLSGFIRTWLGVAGSAFLTINDTRLARPWIDRAMSLPKSAPTTTLAGIVEEMAANAIDPTAHIRSRMDWRRRLAQAAEIYEQAIAIDAGYARAHVRLAHVLLRLDEVPRSRTTADRALTLAQEPVDRYLGALALGASLERQGDLAGARTAYERALAAAPGAQTATVAIGFVDMMAGRPQDAQVRVKAFVASPQDDLYWWEFRNGGVDHAGMAWLRARVGR